MNLMYGLEMLTILSGMLPPKIVAAEMVLLLAVYLCNNV